MQIYSTPNYAIKRLLTQSIQERMSDNTKSICIAIRSKFFKEATQQLVWTQDGWVLAMPFLCMFMGEDDIL